MFSSPNLCFVYPIFWRQTSRHVSGDQGWSVVTPKGRPGGSGGGALGPPQKLVTLGETNGFLLGLGFRVSIFFLLGSWVALNGGKTPLKGEQLSAPGHVICSVGHVG